MTDNNLWTAKETAAHLHITVRRVYTLALESDLPSFDIPMIGKRFDPAEVKAWYRARRQQPRGGVVELREVANG